MHAYDAFASYKREEGHLCDLYEVFLVLAKERRYADFRRNVPFYTGSLRFIFPRIDGPIFCKEETK